ncbi:hypothetical protein BDV38DRAFT_281804 [Aspergillus pseudotamarii]|uniref:NAD(P)-binding protein n=1 Tax=Aspergillus pseudotamarii TaxID=132259 RepID=A0A5N6SZK5_ASPPS|nr:uncharacterized protein BDV38DRAFT_281804 [Aspergillus pseudotamarii]KAE8138873.1 hypothetical protein BDV38DRAFT_281804 [Aspergillus pseudotamarii]
MAFTGRLSGKVAIVTGGGGGFGTGNVQKFVREGTEVVVVDIHPSIATRIANNFPSTQALSLPVDVASETDRKTVLEFTISTFHHLDVVNNGRVNPGTHSTINAPEQDYDLMLSVSLKALYCSSKVVAPYLVKTSREGVFVAVWSISASRPRPGAVCYLGCSYNRQQRACTRVDCLRCSFQSSPAYIG